MKTAGRNDPCPCGSGKKYKKCCLAADGRSPTAPAGGILGSLAELRASVQELDDLSNSVVALIEAEKWEEAEEACHQLRRDHPEQVDGILRMEDQASDRGPSSKQASTFYGVYTRLRLGVRSSSS